MKDTKKIEIDIGSKNCQEKIKVEARLPEILKVRSRQGGFVAWPDNTPNQHQVQKTTAFFTE